MIYILSQPTAGSPKPKSCGASQVSQGRETLKGSPLQGGETVVRQEPVDVEAKTTSGAETVTPAMNHILPPHTVISRACPNTL